MEQKDFFIGIFKGDNKYESLALRMSLATLEDYTGQNSIVGDGKLLKRAMENDSLHSVIFYGHSGCGKNALAKIIATKTKEFFEEANAVLNGNHSDVLNHLKDASLDGKKFWHGYGYKHPHNYPNHCIKQEYIENPVKFYVPSDQDYEVKINERISRITKE